MGTYVPGTETLRWGAWCGTGTPHSQDIHPKFLSTTCGCGNSPFCISTPPTSLHGCGFFNFVVVWLPFNSISDGSEWWLFCSLVVILMRLWKKVSHVYLHLHLDHKSCLSYFIDIFLFCISLYYTLGEFLRSLCQSTNSLLIFINILDQTFLEPIYSFHILCSFTGASLPSSIFEIIPHTYCMVSGRLFWNTKFCHNCWLSLMVVLLWVYPCNHRTRSNWSYPVQWDTKLSVRDNRPKPHVMQPKHTQRRKLWPPVAPGTKVPPTSWHPTTIPEPKSPHPHHYYHHPEPKSPHPHHYYHPWIQVSLPHPHHRPWTQESGQSQHLNTRTLSEAKSQCQCPFTINGHIPRSSN